MISSIHTLVFSYGILASFVDAWTVSTDESASSTDALTDSTDALAGSTDALTDSTDALAGSTDALTDSTDALTDSTDTLTDSTDTLAGLTDALAGSSDTLAGFGSIFTASTGIFPYATGIDAKRNGTYLPEFDKNPTSEPPGNDAFSDSPQGPFTRIGQSVFLSQGVDFPAEDPFIWVQGQCFYALLKDMKGCFTETGQSVSIGWDSSPRFSSKRKEDIVHLDRTPDSFAADLQKTIYYAVAHPAQTGVITLFNRHS